MNTTFKIKDSLSFAWKKMSESFWFLFFLTLGFFIVGALLDKSGSPRSIDVLSSLLGMIWGYFGTYVFVHLGLKIYKGHKPTWNDVLEFDVSLFGMFALGTIVVSVMHIIGFVLFIIPGIILAVRLSLFSFVILDQKLLPIEAIKKSWHLTKGHFWKLLGFGVVLALVNLLGLAAFGIGMLITAPLSLIAATYVYEQLKVSNKVA